MTFNFFTVDESTIAREELEKAGFKQLLTKQEVDEQLSKKGTTLALINSVCGCAASIAQPAVISFAKQENKPDHLVTVFAGQDSEATEAFRSYFPEEKPTSPSIALLKNGELIKIWHRENIEGRQAFLVLNELETTFKEVD